MKAYYNDTEPFVCDWLSNLMDAELITPGRIDDRSIHDVDPTDLAGYNRVHAFAGIGIWDYALNLAGWGDRPVFTGSCPCQPWSVAGRRKGVDDERHLWPEWFRLIRACRPETVFLEQVAGPAGRHWLDLVFADMESEGYTLWAADLAAASVGAPHRRQRLFGVAFPQLERQQRPQQAAPVSDRHQPHGRLSERSGDTSLMAHPSRNECRERRTGGTNEGRSQQPARCGADGVALGDAEGERSTRRSQGGWEARRRAEHAGELGNPSSAGLARPSRQSRDDGEELASTERASGAAHGFWDDVEWLWCRDGKWRPAQPGLPVLASRITNRVGLLRGLGNSICAPLAAEFISAYLDTLEAGL